MDALVLTRVINKENTMNMLMIIPGPTGPTGPAGVPGMIGSQGAAPLDIYNNPTSSWRTTDQTYFQTLSDFNSFTKINEYYFTDSGRVVFGPSGPKGFSFPGFMGKTGPSGLMGPSGPSGAIGLSSFLCLNPNLQIYNFCFGLPGPYGNVGLSGFSGPTGPSGFMGPSGFAGQNGKINAYVFSKVSGISDRISGPTGPIGFSGPAGISYITGVIGIIGPTGPSGLAGQRGPSGQPGQIGPTGPSGFPGRQLGGVGIIGPLGPMGISGPTGPSSNIRGLQGEIGKDISYGNSYQIIHAGDNKIQNGLNLLNAYNFRKNYSNPHTIILTPGIYDLNGQNLNLYTNIRIFGFGDPETIRIQSNLAPLGIGVLNQNTDNIYLENISIQNTYSGNNQYCQPDYKTCLVSSGSGMYFIERGRNPSNNCEFELCSGESGKLASGEPNVFSSRQRCAFNNNYVNISFGSNNLIFEKVFDFNNKIAFKSKNTFFQNGSNKKLIFIKKSFVSNLSNTLDDQLYISGQALNQSNYFDLINQSTQRQAIPCRGSCNSNNPGALDYWVLIAAEIGFDTYLNKITSINNEILLLIEKSKAVNIQGGNTLNLFSFWPWNINGFKEIASTQTLNQYQIAMPYSIKLKNVENSIFKNVKFLENASSENVWSYGMHPSNYYGGKFIDCDVGFGGFGGKDGYLNGEFLDCKGGQQSFTYITTSGETGISNATIKNCLISGFPNANGFGGPNGGIIHGEFRDLLINNFSGNSERIGVIGSGAYLNNVFYTKYV